MLKFLTQMNSTQFRGLLRGAAVTIGAILSTLGVINLAEPEIARKVDLGLSIFGQVVGLLLIVVPMVQGFIGRTNEAIAQKAVDVAPQETAARLVAAKPVETLQAVAESPAVAEIKTTSPTLAANVPSNKVVLDPASPRF